MFKILNTLHNFTVSFNNVILSIKKNIFNKKNLISFIESFFLNPIIKFFKHIDYVLGIGLLDQIWKVQKMRIRKSKFFYIFCSDFYIERVDLRVLCIEYTLQAIIMVIVFFVQWFFFSYWNLLVAHILMGCNKQLWLVIINPASYVARTVANYLHSIYFSIEVYLASKYHHYYVSDITRSFYKIPTNTVATVIDGTIKGYEVNNKYFVKTSPINLNIYSLYTPNVHFLSKNSLIVAILSAWQYWWWLSFIAIIILFNKILFKFLFDTNMYVNPKIHNSLKSNGRWGDIIASIFPVFWCSNILLNSNLILRLTENHSESSWMTLRVRGKQWYWVYKLPIHLKQDFDNLPIIIGRGNKLDIKQTQMPISVKYQKKFTLKTKKYIVKSCKIQNRKLSYIVLKNNFLASNTSFDKQFKKTLIKIYQASLKRNLFIFAKQFKANKFLYKVNKNELVLLKSNVFNKTTNFLNLSKKNNFFLKKYYRHFYTLQQQPKTNWNLKKKIIFNTNRTENIKKLKFFELSTMKKKNFLKKQRLVSSYNTLLLPVGVNITVITNSFDVVHSWFIPGLGVKFDCGEYYFL